MRIDNGHISCGINECKSSHIYPLPAIVDTTNGSKLDPACPILPYMSQIPPLLLLYHWNVKCLLIFKIFSMYFYLPGNIFFILLNHHQKTLSCSCWEEITAAAFEVADWPVDEQPLSPSPWLAPLRWLTLLCWQAPLCWPAPLHCPAPLCCLAPPLLPGLYLLAGPLVIASQPLFVGRPLRYDRLEYKNA